MVTALGPHWVVAVTPDLYICSVSGVVATPHTGTIVAVGDNVWIEPKTTRTDQGDLAAVIVRVEERATVLSRKAAGKTKKEQVLVANVQQLGIVMSAVLPNYNKRLIDRYLIAADKGNLRPFIVINKIDLIDAEYHPDFEDDLRVYSHQLAIPLVFASARTGKGFGTLQNLLTGTSTLLAGPSGVGKSSLINQLTDARQRVGAISEKYEKGKHTTTNAIVIPLAGGGVVVDSPGIREFGIFELSETELPFYFEEFTGPSEHCRYKPCSHTHEPHCAVKHAVESGIIDAERYASYCALREEIRRA